MGTGDYSWRGVIPAWAGIGVACGAAIVIEWLLLDGRLWPAVVGTLLVAVVTGVLVTRRLRARNHQPLITVRDLRRR